MTRSDKPGLVIDASIANAAGGLGKEDQGSTMCTNFLESVSNHDYYMVITRAISEEWNAHCTYYSYKWRNKMVGRKRVKTLGKADNPELERHFQSCFFKKETQRKALDKDMLLLEAALASDKRIASLDEKARTPARTLAASCPFVRDILWINPSKPEEAPLQWLAAGAPMDARRLLGHQAQ